MSDQVELPDNASLEIIKGDDEGLTFPINHKSVNIGRKDECDLVLSDSTVSNKHCQIVFRGGHFSLIDLGSLNKTKVNDKVIVQKNLDDGDVIGIGKTKIKFIWPDSE